jgi:hypothetical protein
MEQVRLEKSWRAEVSFDRFHPEVMSSNIEDGTPNLIEFQIFNFKATSSIARCG